MQTGRPITQPGEPMSDWLFVTSDLHDIHKRVQEYDSLARLVWNKHTGHLGLARHVPAFHKIRGYDYLLAVDLEFTGEPDARVIHRMYELDSHNYGGGMKKYYRDLVNAGLEFEHQQAKVMQEEVGDMPEEWAYWMYRDKGRKDRVAF